MESGVVMTGFSEEVFHIIRSLSTLVLKPIPFDIPYTATPLNIAHKQYIYFKVYVSAKFIEHSTVQQLPMTVMNNSY